MSKNLRIELKIDAPPHIVWRAYTLHATEWFTPRPWTTPKVDYQLYPGGRADVIMQSPEGEQHSYRGVVLEVVPERLIVTTGAMTEGWEPQEGDMHFIRLDRFEPDEGGTLYSAEARHWSQEAADRHKLMGFTEGWGMAARQLAEVAVRLAGES